MLGGSSFPPKLKYFCLLGVRKHEHDAADPKTCLHHFLPHLFGDITEPGLVLEWLDRNLAEFDYARAVLQREVPLLEHSVPDVDGFLPVEHHDEMPPIGGDLESVPLAGGLGHRVHFGEIDDRAGAVARVGALVEDVDLVAGPSADGSGILCIG